MAFVIGLPTETENSEYTIISVEGGFPASSVLAMFRKKLAYLDLNIKINGVETTATDDVEIDGVMAHHIGAVKIAKVRKAVFFSLLRVHLAGSIVAFDEDREGVITVHNALGEFLDLDGKETGRFVSLYFYVNTQVTYEGMPTGMLTMWSQ